MVRAFAFGLLWLYSFPKERNGSISSATVAAQTSYHHRPVFPNRLFGAYHIALGPSSPCQLHALRTSITHIYPRLFSLSHTQSHSATTVAYESITHTSTIGSTHAANGAADRLVSFPLAYFGRHNIALLSLYLDAFQ